MGFSDRAYRTVVITGASAGIGRAAAHEFARRGARLGLLARDAEALGQVVREVRELGGEGLALSCDVADPLGVEEAARRVEEHFGPIDVWVNDAMTTVFAPFEAVTPEEFRRVTEVCYLGYVHGTMAALKRMKARDRGVIIQVGSALAYRAIPLQSAYCGAKHAIKGFTDSLRSELIHDGSRVHLTMVQMPAVNTPQFEWCRNKLPHEAQPVPPVFQPEVAARAIEWSARHRRRELLVGGSTLKAVWANYFIPGWLDHYLAGAAWSGQQRKARTHRGRADNLFAPVGGLHATHGPFDHLARGHSLQLQAEMRRPLLLAGAALAGFLLGKRCLGKRCRRE